MKTITSQELLKKAEANKQKNQEMPLELRPLIITSVINCIPAKILRDALGVDKDVTVKHVLAWQKTIREWLGLPPIGRGKPSDEYKENVTKWLNNNGNPTPDQIDQGWLPTHLSKKKRKLSPLYQAELEETREQIYRLREAKSDEELRKLCKEFLEKMGVNYDIDKLIAQTMRKNSTITKQII